MSEPIEHPSINVHAPREYWIALGEVAGRSYRVYSKDGRDVLQVTNSSGADVLLLQGIAHTNSHDHTVICWVLDEIQRRREEKARIDAQIKEAEAVTALAGALRSETEQAFLERLLPMLTENTRHAVRNQLAGF